MHLAFVHYLQLARVSFLHFWRYQLCTIFTPNQDQLVSIGRETIVCTVNAINLPTIFIFTIYNYAKLCANEGKKVWKRYTKCANTKH